MAGKRQELARWIYEYRRTTGIKEVDHHNLATWLKKRGWPMPVPADPVDMLAKQLSEVARLETRKDNVSGEDYRAYHAFTVPQPNGQQLTLWVDIDEATRSQMRKSGINKREQMVGEAVRHTIDFDHWNRINPDQEPLQFPLDFTDDVEWRRNAPDENEKAS
jgi:hypothetical protein